MCDAIDWNLLLIAAPMIVVAIGLTAGMIILACKPDAPKKNRYYEKERSKWPHIWKS